MFCLGAKAVDAKTSTARIGNEAACADSAVGAPRPTRAKIHENDTANIRSSRSDARNDSSEVWTRKPTRNPTATIINTTPVLRTRSDRQRPASTAERAIGNDLNRSMRPLCRSSLRPTPVFIAPNATVWMNTPGMRKSTYGMPPGGWVEPPNTYRNVRMKMIGWIGRNMFPRGARDTPLRWRQAMVGG